MQEEYTGVVDGGKGTFCLPHMANCWQGDWLVYVMQRNSVSGVKRARPRLRLTISFKDVILCRKSII